MAADLVELKGMIEAALPGIRPEDVEITVENGTLTISAQSGEERTEKNDQGEVLVQEIRRGSMSRSSPCGTSTSG